MALPEYASLQELLRYIQSCAEMTEEHMHHKVHWYGKLAVQTETHWADGASLTPFRAISGNNTWGADPNDEAQVFGSEDTLTDISAGLLCGDFDQILVIANTSATVYKCRLVWGTGTLADAVTAKQYSEFVYLRGIADQVRKIQLVTVPLIEIDNKIWMQCWNATDNATIDFLVGVHGYGFLHEG